MRRHRRLPLAALLLAALLRAAGAEGPAPAPPPATTTTVPGATPGPDTPRGALVRFLEAARAGDYAIAAQYLDLRNVRARDRARRGPELARELETVLDRALWVDPSRQSADPDGDPNDGLPALHDSAGLIDTRDGPVAIILARVQQPNGVPVWKFDANTVAAIPGLWDEFGWGPLADVLPAPFFEIRFLGIRLWQWIGLALLLAVAALLSAALGALVWRLARWWRPVVPLPAYARGPLRLGLAVAVFAAGMPFLALAFPVARFFIGVETGLGIVAATWLALRALDALAQRLEHRLPAHHARAVASLLLGRRAVKVFIAILAAIAALQNFGFNVTGILAGLGVGGLAVALAAQKTVENLFGSVSLVADQPVRVGDVCRFGDTVGTVEDIGLRSTRVRTVDRTLVTVPNAQFSTLALENLSRRDRIPVRATLKLPVGTSAADVRRLLAALHQMLVAQPKIDVGSARVRFAGLGTQCLEIELFALVCTASWEEFVGIREQIFLGALDIVGDGAADLKKR